MESNAIKFIKQKYCADPNDKQGFINGNFWNGIADFMTDFSAHENATLIDQNRKLRNDLEYLVKCHTQIRMKCELPDALERAERTLKDLEDGK